MLRWNRDVEEKAAADWRVERHAAAIAGEVVDARDDGVVEPRVGPNGKALRDRWDENTRTGIEGAEEGIELVDVELLAAIGECIRLQRRAAGPMLIGDVAQRATAGEVAVGLTMQGGRRR